MNFLKSEHLGGPVWNVPTIQRIHADWSKCIGRDATELERPYDDYLSCLRALVATQTKTKPPSFLSKLFKKEPAPLPDPETLYRFILCFSSNSYLVGYSRGRPAQEHYGLNHEAQMALVDKLLELPDVTLTQAPQFLHKGTLGEAIEAALLVCGYHKGFSAQREIDISYRALKLLQRCPYLYSNMTVALLEKHPNLIQEAAALIRDTYQTHELDRESGVLRNISLRMVGQHVRRDSGLKKGGAKIMAQVLCDPESWTHEQLAALTERFAIKPLDIPFAIGTADQHVQVERDIIANNEADIAAGFTAQPNWISPQVALKNCKTAIENAKAKLRQIEQDFDGLRAEQINTAARHLAQANTSRKTIEVMAKALPADLAAPLQAVLTQINAAKDKPKTFAMPKASDNRFKDFGFKMMVIEELMYDQNCLGPAFDVRVFADEWTDREISIQDEGNSVIPEVQTYFENLAIPDKMLAKVEILTQKFSLSGSGWGETSMEQLHPRWDPGMGDGPVPVTDKAVADLDLLPNLKCVVGLEHEINDPLPSKLIKALEARGVHIVDEEDVV